MKPGEWLVFDNRVSWIIVTLKIQQKRPQCGQNSQNFYAILKEESWGIDKTGGFVSMIVWMTFGQRGCMLNSFFSPLTCRILYPHSPLGGRPMFDKESLWLRWEARLLYGTQSRQESSAQCREAVRSWACPTPTWSTSRLMQPLMWVLCNNLRRYMISSCTQGKKTEAC